MTDKLALDLPVLLPDAIDGRDRCVDRLVASLDREPGLDEVHVVDATETTPARLCLHYDPATTGLHHIRELAEAAGAHLTDRYQHVLWPQRTRIPARRAAAVERELRAAPGVVEVSVTASSIRAEVDTAEGGLDALATAADRLGLDVGDADHRHVDDHDHGDHHGHDHGGRAELYSAIAAGVLWVAGMVAEHAADAHRVATGLFVASFALAGWFVARETLDKLRTRTFEIDLLMLVAAVGAASIGRWPDAALLLVLFGLGHALEGYAMDRAQGAIDALAELAPDTAVLLDGEREVPVGELRQDDVILVRPNARIAADGFVVSGTSSVDQSALTGEGIPVDKTAVVDAAAAAADPEAISASGRVFAGTINGSGRLEVQVLRAAGASTLAKVAAMVRDAEAEPSPTQRFTDRFQRVFVPAALALVVVVFVVGVTAGWGWHNAFYRSMAVLVAASPCALALAIPSAVLAAIARAGQRGVLVKGGGALQQLGSVRAVAFDKTGTITAGRPSLVDVVPAPDVDADELLRVAVAIERQSDHPLARAVVRDASALLAANRGQDDAPVHISARGTGDAEPDPNRGQDDAPVRISARGTSETAHALAGRGVVGSVEGREVVVGNPRMFEERGGLDAATAAVVGDLERAGRTIVVVRRDGAPLGVLGLLDTPRDSAAESIAALRHIGIRHTVVLSGDHQAAVDAVASEVGVDEARGDLLPADKVVAVEELRTAHGTVAMVGDGVNDAPALAHASVGIAMGAAGSDVALETADVALMGDDLRLLPFAFGLGRQASWVIRQNLIASLGIVFVLLVATVTGLAGIGPAVVLHEGSTVLVVANALRLLRYRERS